MDAKSNYYFNGAPNHLGTYYAGKLQDCSKVVQVMKEEGKTVGKVSDTDDGFLVHLQSGVVLDFFNAAIKNNRTKQVTGAVMAFAKNTLVLPGQDVLFLSKVMHAPFLMDKERTKQDAVLTHVKCTNHEDISTDTNNYSVFILNEGDKRASITTYTDASFKNAMLLPPSDIVDKVEKLNLYSQPETAFNLSSYLEELNGIEIER